VRNGGAGVQLGSRVLAVCEVRSRIGSGGETPFAATRALCRHLCDAPLLPKSPVFGTNDWYYSYGNSHPDTLIETTKAIVSLSPAGPNRPWSVIDDGWEPTGDDDGMWDRGNAKFGDMAAFARAAVAQSVAEPIDWLDTTCPARWRLGGRETRFDWAAAEGPWPFKD
jgi:alpha-galactosidase